MEKKELLMTLAMVTICIATCSAVHFEYNGRECTYWERRAHGRTRYLEISCPSTRNPVRAASNCSYRGDPHSCRDYNRRQPQFYHGLNDAMVRSSTLCTAPTVTNRNLCPEIVFTLDRRPVVPPVKLSGLSEETAGDVKLDEDVLVNPDEMSDEEEDDELIFRPDV
ncbi:hypothetical protein ACF0H5_017380 [Mactra antiquata]